MKYLIDTNICIYIMNKRPVEIIRRFKEFEVGEISISSITTSELYYGVSKSTRQAQNLKRLQEFILPFEILPYDEMASEYYGEIRFHLENRGTVIGPLDLLIAAHALSQDLVLITNNEKEFRRVPSLKVENWA